MKIILLNNLKFIFITFFVSITIYAKNPNSIKGPIKTAKFLEKNGDVEGAIAIYEGVLLDNPQNRQSFQSLKSIYLKYSMYDRGIVFLRNKISQEPNDIRTYCELGELHYLNKQIKEANSVWYTALKKFKYNRPYYRIMISTLAKYNLENEMNTILSEGRNNFGKAFLAYEVGLFYQNNSIYDKAIKEYILYLINEKNLNGIIERKILSMSDEEEALEIIENHLISASKTNPNKILNILSEFYFKQQKYSMSFKAKKEWTLSGNKDFDQWIKFANELRRENQYQHAMDAYNFILGYKINSRLTERALLGLGQTFEDQITTTNEESLIPYFFDNNVFFKDPFQIYTSISNEHLESSLNLYDSMLISLTKSLYLSEAYFRLGEIQYKILQDFDKSFTMLNKALNYKSNKVTRLKIIFRITDVLIAQGKTKHALDFLNKQLQNENLEDINQKIILVRFLTQDPDSSLHYINQSFNNITPSNVLFNDLMELKNILTNYCKEPIDKSAFIHFQKSELYLRQKKVGDAIKELEFLEKHFPNSQLTSITHLRLATLNYRIKNYDKTLDYALMLKKTKFEDRGIILAGQIHENQMLNQKKALKYYMEILNNFSTSIYYEPIRYHVRKIKKTES